MSVWPKVTVDSWTPSPSKPGVDPARDAIDREWLKALFAYIENHKLDPARTIQEFTTTVLTHRDGGGR